MKITKLSAACASLALALAGCGGDKETEAEAPATTEETTAEQTEDASEAPSEDDGVGEDEEDEDDWDGFDPIPPQPQDVTESILTGADLYSVNPCEWISAALDKGGDDLAVNLRVTVDDDFAPYTNFVARDFPHYYMNYTEAGFAFTHVASCGADLAELKDELEYDEPSFHDVQVQEGQVEIYDRDFARDNNIDIIEHNGRIGQCVTREMCAINLDAEHYLKVTSVSNFFDRVPEDFTQDDVVKPLLLALTDVLDDPAHADIFTHDVDSLLHSKVCGALDVAAIGDFLGEDAVLSEIDSQGPGHVRCNFADREGSEETHLSVFFFTGPDTNRTETDSFEDSGMRVGAMKEDEFAECEAGSCRATVAVAQHRVSEDLVYSIDIATDDVVPAKTSKDDRLNLFRALRPAVDVFMTGH